MKNNKDGSLRLGTLQTSTILELVLRSNLKTTEQYTSGLIEQSQYESQLIDIDAINTAKLAVDAEVAKLEAVIKRTLDNRLKVRIVPKEPASTENVEVPFILDTYVSYMKRKNPTRSTSTAKEINIHRKTSLFAQLHDLVPDSPEWITVRDQLINM